MRFLLTFLLFYFIYRYGMFLFKKYLATKKSGDAQTPVHTHKETTAASKPFESGEYVDYEVLKED